MDFSTILLAKGEEVYDKLESTLSDIKGRLNNGNDQTEICTVKNTLDDVKSALDVLNYLRNRTRRW
ncbi:hypothetical protein [Peribacillus glennii]|uniref:Uncharacterized protein n=1 Tax=Peribacillus glennii TaxID=2303991 RepID=A0A372LJK4_9BACI|nr:hypothetical protein [Peribacillus glennii]RFU66605.1 hypothetical protein D0466_00365 [Peribacillus glennii]